MEQFTFAILVLAWISFLIWSAKYAEWLWMRVMGFRLFRIMIAPGIIVHEYSHALACLVTGTKIHEIKLFKRDGGHVKHDKPASTVLGIPWVGRRWEQKKARFFRTSFLSSFLISFAPVAGCLAVIWLMGILTNYTFDTNIYEAGTPTDGGSTAQDVSKATGDFGSLFGAYFSLVWRSFGALLNPFSVLGVLGIVYAWLLLSLSIAMAPSGRDIRNATFGIIIMLILLVIVSAALSQNEAVFQRAIESVLPMMAYTTAVMALVMLVTSIIAPTLLTIMRGSID